MECRLRVVSFTSLNFVIGLSLQTTALVFCSNPAALPAKTNGYIRVDCYGGLNQMRRDVSFKKAKDPSSHELSLNHEDFNLHNFCVRK